MATPFNKLNVDVVQPLGVDGETPAGVGNPIMVALTAGTGSAALTTIPISASAIGTSVLVTGSGTAIINIFKLVLSNTTATALTFDGNATAILGPISLPANGFVTLPFDANPWASTAPGANLILSNTVTSVIGGSLSYALS